ncbi:hypothetical protein OYC64_020794 [Pagothenia borchgrevinki]
MRLLNHS